MVNPSAIQVLPRTPVGKGLGNVTGSHSLVALKVGHRPGQAEDAVVAPGAQFEPGHTMGEEFPLLVAQGEHVMESFTIQPVVGCPIGIAINLSPPGLEHTVAEDFRGLHSPSALETPPGSGSRKENFGVYRVDQQVDIDAVKQGPTDPLEIALPGMPAAGAFRPALRIGPIPTARAGVHGCHQLEIGREDHCGPGPADGHFPGF